MDNHPEVRHEAYPSLELEVPYIDNPRYKYDSSDFLRFLERKGLGQTPAYILAMEPPEVAAILQAWLFFGLMIEIFGLFGVSFTPNDFIMDPEEGKAFVTTEELPKYLWYCLAGDLAMHSEVRNETAERFDACLILANAFINEVILQRQQNRALPNSSTLEVVILSITILGETFQNLRQRLSIFDGDQQQSLRLTWVISPFLDFQLWRAGWCKGEITVLRNKFSSCWAIYFLSLFDRHYLNRTHILCSSEECRADQVDEASYRTKHTTNSCECTHLSLEDESLVSSILHAGQVPVVSLSKAFGGQERLRFQASTEVDAYVAISHVWSDGLGNPHQNSLPMCQILQIQRLVDSLYTNHDFDGNYDKSHDDDHDYEDDSSEKDEGGEQRNKENEEGDEEDEEGDEEDEEREREEGNKDGDGKGGDGLEDNEEKDDGYPLHIPFWIDTLCVPLEKSLRKHAIRLMAKTYQDAKKVLVLDSFVRRTSKNPSAAEVLIKIKASTWTRRLWTLQEGMLARERGLYFQLQDGVLGAHHLGPFDSGTLNLFQRMNELFDDQDLNRVAHDNSAAISVRRALACLDRAPNKHVQAIKAHFPDFPNDNDRSLLNKIFNFEISDHLVADGYIYLRHISNFQRLGVENDLYTVATYVKNRLTSKPEDETICIATLLQMDPTLLLSTPPKERMKVLLCSIERFNPALVFHNLPRISEETWRWAPTSFLTNERVPEVIHMLGNPPAIRHRLGLIVQFPGHLLGYRQPGVAGNLLYLSYEGCSYEIVLCGNFCWEQFEGMNLAVIHSLQLEEMHLAAQTEDAILVRINHYDDDADTYFTWFCENIVIRKVIEVENSSLLCQAVSTKKRQGWCVG